MGVIADVFFAVAVITVAAGTVAEFQIRMGHIRLTADSAAVRIRRIHRGNRCFVRSRIGEGNRFGLLGSIALFLPEQPPEICLPGQGNHVHNILAEEQEVIGKGYDGEEITGERFRQQTH